MLDRGAAPRRPAAQGDDPAPGHGARRHVEPARGAAHLLEGVLRGRHLPGDGRPRRREDRVRPPQLRRGQRPRAGHQHRPADGPRVGHERARRADGVARPPAGVPRRGPDDPGPRVQRRDGAHDRRGDLPHPRTSRRRGRRSCSPSTAGPRSASPRRCSSRRRSTVPRSPASCRRASARARSTPFRPTTPRPTTPPPKSTPARPHRRTSAPVLAGLVRRPAASLALPLDRSAVVVRDRGEVPSLDPG